MHPYRQQYPDDMYLHFLRTLRLAHASGPDTHLLVSYKLDPNGNELITGIAQWTRFRTHPPSSMYTNMAKFAMEWYNYLESFIYPNRACDPSRTGILAALYPFMSHFWTGSRAEVYDLTLLGVDSNAKGQGHGQKLVNWGFERAGQEGVGCSVVCAAGTEPFYRKCGFDVVAGGSSENGGEENPQVKAGFSGGTVMFWDNKRSLEGVKKYGEV